MSKPANRQRQRHGISGRDAQRVVGAAASASAAPRGGGDVIVHIIFINSVMLPYRQERGVGIEHRSSRPEGGLVKSERRVAG